MSSTPATEMLYILRLPEIHFNNATVMSSREDVELITIAAYAIAVTQQLEPMCANTSILLDRQVLYVKWTNSHVAKPDSCTTKNVGIARVDIRHSCQSL